MVPNDEDARRISEMRNLGPASEQDLNAAGIMNAGNLIRLGPEEAFLQMMEARARRGRDTKCCNASYLYAIHGAIHELDWREIPDEVRKRYKKLTAKLRQSGQYR